MLKRLVQRLRQVWPQVKIMVRGDAGFCRWRMLRWCEQNKVHYLVGLARNARVQALAQPLIEQSEQAFLQTQEQPRRLGEVH